MSDLDALLSEVETGSKAPAAGGSGGKKKKRRNKKQKGAAGDEAAETEAAPTPKASAEAEAKAALAELGIGGDDADGADGGGGKKKKRRAKKKKGGGDDTPEAEDTAPAAPAAPAAKGGKKKVSAAKAAMMRRKEEQERRRQEEEARRQAEEEERKRLEEEAAAEEEERLRKKLEKDKRIEELKRQGKYKSKKQLQRERAARERVEQMRRAGIKIAGLEKEEKGAEAAEEEAKAAEEAREAAKAKAKAEAEAKAKAEAEEAERKKREEAAEEAELDWEAVEQEEAAFAGVAATEAVLAGDGDADSDDFDDLFDAIDEEEPAAEAQGDGTTPAAAAATAAATAAASSAAASSSSSGAGGDGDGDDSDDDLDDDWLEEADAIAAKAKQREEKVARRAAKEEAVREAVAAERSKGAAAADLAAGIDLEERIWRSRQRRKARRKAAKKERSPDRLRSPICCVLGHVDTGKTSLLDRIRRTNVQGGEAGGITQQIGATYFPMSQLSKQTDKVNKDLKLEYRIPGLLVVDTPGHEAFSNLRTRGSNLCDIAVLVVDIMHGLEPQTLESLDLLRKSRTPFVVALNKVDRVYGWEANTGAPIRETLAKQKSYSTSEFETRTRDTVAAFAEQGLNAALYYENDDFKRTVSLVPTSAHTGEGIPDLLMLLTQLTQQLMVDKLMFTPTVQCSVLEVKSIDGLGTTIDVCLINGELHEGDEIVVCGMSGPIHTTIRALLTPPPAREIRVKADYIRNSTITAAMGIKVAANGLEKAVAGTQLLVVHKDDEVEDLKREVSEDLEATMQGFATDSLGVHVQASTLGSLEALLEHLRSSTPPVPVASVGVGPVHKRDVIQCSAMLARAPEYAIMLCFDIPIMREAEAEAEAAGIRVFSADIIYHLTDRFEEHLAEARERKRAEAAEEVAFPCILKIITKIHEKAPIMLGIEVEEGILRKGTPVCCTVGLKADGSGPMVLELGKVTSIQRNSTDVDRAEPGEPAVAIKIEGDPSMASIAYGRHFDSSNPIYSRITRRRIDLLKREFRDELSIDEWKVVKKLKSILGVE